MWKLVADSGEFHLTLSNAYRAHFFQLEIRIKKDILSENRNAPKNVSLRPKAAMLTPISARYCNRSKLLN